MNTSSHVPGLENHAQMNLDWFVIHIGFHVVSRYHDYSSSQNAREKVGEVSDIQKSLSKHDYEIDVVEDILPLQRVKLHNSRVVRG